MSLTQQLKDTINDQVVKYQAWLPTEQGQRFARAAKFAGIVLVASIFVTVTYTLYRALHVIAYGCTG